MISASDDSPNHSSKPDRSSGTSPSGRWEPPAIEALQQLLPQYEILGLLGRGGMGAVYKARQKSLIRTVAIKILPVDAANDELNLAGRFRNEAVAMARLNHPGIVNVHDAGEAAGGLLYFIMEHVEGDDLAHAIAVRGRLPETEVKSIAVQVCDALNYLHDHGIVHRDIKPANILLDAQGRVKVADFGLAKLAEPEVSALLTRTGTSLGTAEFMAPECRRAAAMVDHRADLYSLGVAIYQMLTGELPQGMFKLPSQVLPDVDERFDDIVSRALEPKPDDRYQSAAEMRAALAEVCRLVAAKPNVGKTPPPSALDNDPPPPKSNRQLLVLGIVIAGALSLAALTLVMRTAGAKATLARHLNAGEKAPGVQIKRDGKPVGPLVRPAMPPHIPNWRNITENLRQEASAMPGLGLAVSEIRRTTDGPPPVMTLMPLGSRNYAVRIRYTDEVEIRVRSSPSGFLCIKGTARQTSLTRELKGETKPMELVLANHPDGPWQPHELLVSVFGTRIRLWMDHQFAGEAQDDRIREGEATVAFLPRTQVHTVAIAELMADPPAATPVDEAFLRAVAAAPPDEQVALVVAKIKELNIGKTVIPGPTLTEGHVTGFHLGRDGDDLIRDMSPVAAFKHLKTLTCLYQDVEDLSCLKGLKLDRLTIHHGRFTDIAVLRELPLKILELRGGIKVDYRQLTGLQLERLDLETTSVSDISFVKGMPLKYLSVARTQVRDLSPLAGVPLIELKCNADIMIDAELLRSIPTLQKINDKPVTDVPSAAGSR